MQQPNNNKFDDNLCGLSYLRQLTGGDEDLVQELIGEMKTQWLSDKAVLLQIGLHTNFEAVRKILHKLKSTFSPLGGHHILYTHLNNLAHNLKSNQLQIDVQLIKKSIDLIDGALKEVEE